jgi:hypothetical protein
MDAQEFSEEEILRMRRSLAKQWRCRLNSVTGGEAKAILRRALCHFRYSRDFPPLMVRPTNRTNSVAKVGNSSGLLGNRTQIGRYTRPNCEYSGQDQ